MDKEEFKIKLEEINSLVDRKDYKNAMTVVDSIDWRRVKNVRTLCVVGEIYAANKRYEDAREIFLLAYHRASIGKNILYRLIEVSLKLNDVDEALEYYDEFCSVAPNDNTSLILKYKILKAQGSSIEEQISVLEKYKDKEFTEKWAYELANLYYTAGMNDKCEDLCNEMILWFSEGNYVIKALNLKQMMGVMTDGEKKKYENELKVKTEQTEKSEEKDSEEQEGETEQENDDLSEGEEEIDSVALDQNDIRNSETLQEKITKGLRDIFGRTKASETESEDYEMELPKEDFTEVIKLEEEGEAAVKTEEVKEETAETFEAETPVMVDDDPMEKKEEEEEKEKKEKELSQTRRLPELKIPKAMRRMSLEPEKVELKKEPITETVTENEIKEESGEDDFDFNLEDTILAAATAQGIEIPEDTKKEEPVEEESVESEAAPVTEADVEEETEKTTEAVKEEAVPEEEEISEEDLIAAEQEFMNGPAGKKSGIEVPDLDESDIFNSFDAETDESDDQDKPLVFASEVEDFGEEYDDEDEDLDEEYDDEDEDLDEEYDEDEEDFDEEYDDEDEEDFDEEYDDEDEEDFDEEYDDEDEEDFDEEYDEDEEDFDEEYDDEDEEDFDEEYDEDEEDFDEEYDDEDEEDFDEEDEDDEEDLNEEYLDDGEDGDAELTEEEEIEQFIDSIDPVNTLPNEEIIEREHKLTDHEEKLFSYFVKVPGMRDQIIDALVEVQNEAVYKDSKTGNVIVMGGNETGKTRLISALIPAICKELRLSAAKIAYVFADQLNGKDMNAVTQKLAGGFLVIEEANQLDPKTAANLSLAMEEDTDGLIVILEDDKIGMRKLIARYPKLAKKFTANINIPVFTNDELANFARIYAMENGYKIENMGMLALYDRIGNGQKADQPMNIGTVKEIVDSAIAKSQGGLFKRKSKKVDSDGFRVLYEKDFNVR